MISRDAISGKKSARYRLALVTFAVAVVALFLVANRRAYKGFFTSDDFDNMANGLRLPLSGYVAALFKSNLGGRTTFRPVAHFYYFLMVRLAGLHFAPYVIGIQILHLLNAVLVWLLVRNLGANLAGAGAAALLFALNMTVFQVYWEPMYIFDLVCGTFCLLCLLSYIRGRTILSLVLFWLAIKAKEVAIFLPVVLAGYEWWFGGKRWKRIAPFFVISTVLVCQALIFNVRRDDDYSLRFTPAAVWKCARFYAARLMPGLGVSRVLAFSLLAFPFFIRDRRARFGIFSFVCLLSVMLVLPGRLFEAYLYVPLIGLAIALSAASRPAWLAAFFVVWIPWSYYQTRTERDQEITMARDRRAWVEPVAKFVRAHPEIDTLVYNDPPAHLWDWGVDGMLRNLRPVSPPVGILERSPDFRDGLQKPHLALLIWDSDDHQVSIVPRVPDVSYIQISPFAPAWQLGEGWIGHGQIFRWIGPQASARLLRPASVRSFEVTVWVTQIYLDSVHQGRLDLFLDHKFLGSGALDKPARSTFRFEVPAAQAGPVEVEFTVSPPLKDPQGSSLNYAAGIMAFGFVK